MASRHRGIGSVLAVVGAVLIVATALAPVAAQDPEPPPGAGRVLVLLSPHGIGGPLLRYTLIASLAVTEQAGQTTVSATLPGDATMDRFTAVTAGVREPDQTQVLQSGDRGLAVARWDAGGPDAGDWVTMRLEAHGPFDETGETAVTWRDLPTNLTSVRIMLPPAYTPHLEPAYAPQIEPLLDGLVVWNLTQPPSGGFEFTITATQPGADPALAAPPARWAGFAVIAGIAVFAALAWFVGKKLDARLRRD